MTLAKNETKKSHKILSKNTTTKLICYVLLLTVSQNTKLLQYYFVISIKWFILIWPYLNLTIISDDTSDKSQNEVLCFHLIDYLLLLLKHKM